MIIADVVTIPTWAAVAGSVLFLTTIGSSVATIWLAVRKPKIEPQPLLVEMERQVVTKDEFHRHEETNEATHKDLFSKIGGMNRGFQADLLKLSNDVAGLERETINQNAWLSRIDAKLDQRTVPPPPPLTRM
jgi:hypothetical protein